MMRDRCRWCESPMTPKPGKEFCGNTCRHRFHTALRLWARTAFDDEIVGVPTLKRVLQRAGEACTANKAVLEG